MSLLLAIWVFSLIAIIATVFYARSLAAKTNGSVGGGHMQLNDLVRLEVGALYRDAVEFLERMRPHGARTARRGMVILKRGQELFIRRVYGRIGAPKGRVSSFFLKQIAEHQGKDVERGNSERGL